MSRRDTNDLKKYGPWSEQTSSSGRKYYYNSESEVSQWEKPKEWREHEQKLEQERLLQAERDRQMFQPPQLLPPPPIGPPPPFMNVPPPYMPFIPPPFGQPGFPAMPAFAGQPYFAPMFTPPPPPGALIPPAPGMSHGSSISVQSQYSSAVPPPPMGGRSSVATPTSTIPSLMGTPTTVAATTPTSVVPPPPPHGYSSSGAAPPPPPSTTELANICNYLSYSAQLLYQHQHYHQQQQQQASQAAQPIEEVVYSEEAKENTSQNKGPQTPDEDIQIISTPIKTSRKSPRKRSRSPLRVREDKTPRKRSRSPLRVREDKSDRERASRHNLRRTIPPKQPVKSKRTCTFCSSFHYSFSCDRYPTFADRSRRAQELKWCTKCLNHPESTTCKKLSGGRISACRFCLNQHNSAFCAISFP